ncbi:MAG: hypothetical protein ABGZ35_31950 [Planctomycetaceae bacterium]
MTTIVTQLAGELARLEGTVTPTTVALADPDIADLAIDFTAVDSLSCSLTELRLNLPELRNVPIDELERWGRELCDHVSYLLEDIGPLEVDAAGHQVLIRSTPPDERPAGVKFYEIILTSHSSGNCTLRRYESEQGTIGRVPVDIQLTHEVLLKLVGDLLDTAQAAT